MDEQKDQNLEQAFTDIFGGSVSASGDEEMIKAVEKHTLQLTAEQIKAIVWLKYQSILQSSAMLDSVIKFYVEMKHHNNSAPLILRAIEAISLRRFINEQAFKVNLQK